MCVCVHACAEGGKIRGAGVGWGADAQVRDVDV